jgi:cysteine desulfurase
VEGEALLARLDEVGVAASSGAACGSSTWEPSHVLIAMGIPQETAVGSLRFTLGPSNTEEEVDHLLNVLPDLLRSLQEPGGRRPPARRSSPTKSARLSHADP